MKTTLQGTLPDSEDPAVAKEMTVELASNCFSTEVFVDLVIEGKKFRVSARQLRATAQGMMDGAPPPIQIGPPNFTIWPQGYP